MATRTSRPGRTLIVFLLVIVAMFTAAAALGSWKPKLGLDLQGGTRITLQAKATGGGSITEDKLAEAAGIINARVNGAGVAEAEVTTQGSDIIVVEIPGEVDNDLTRTIGSTAQLRFRLVAAALPPEGTATPTPSIPTIPSPTDSTPTGPEETSTTPNDPGATTSTPRLTGPKLSPKDTTTSSGKNRVVPSWAEERNPAPTSTTPTTSPTPTTEGDETPTTPAPSGPPTTPTPSGPPTALVPPDLEQISDPYAWIASPPQEWQAKLAAYTCPKPGEVAEAQLDLPSQPLLACDEAGMRYLLGPAMIEGTDVTNATSGLQQQGVSYVVNMEFNGDGGKKFREVTTKMSVEECMEFSAQVTELGRELSHLDAKVTLEKGVPLLGIEPGTHDVQRLIYWAFLKAFWNDYFSENLNTLVNFDWYHPPYASRHTPEEVRGWCEQAELGIEHLDVSESGISVLARRPG